MDQTGLFGNQYFLLVLNGSVSELADRCIPVWAAFSLLISSWVLDSGGKPPYPPSFPQRTEKESRHSKQFSKCVKLTS